jgi:hypothetical protein
LEPSAGFFSEYWVRCVGRPVLHSLTCISPTLRKHELLPSAVFLGSWVNSNENFQPWSGHAIDINSRLTRPRQPSSINHFSPRSQHRGANLNATSCQENERRPNNFHSFTSIKFFLRDPYSKARSTTWWVSWRFLKAREVTVQISYTTPRRANIPRSNVTSGSTQHKTFSNIDHCVKSFETISDVICWFYPNRTRPQATFSCGNLSFSFARAQEKSVVFSTMPNQITTQYEKLLLSSI